MREFRHSPNLAILLIVTFFTMMMFSHGLTSCGGGGGTATYTVGGTVTGLTGSGLVLQNSGADDLTIPANGSFTFATSLEDAAAYAVTVKTQPSSPDQTCNVTSGSGTISSVAITTVAVACTSTLSSFTRATTDSTGKATFTTSKLTNASSAQITLTLPNGQPASGMTVDFAETDDQYFMFVVYDANNQYQTTVVTADASALSTDISVAGKALYLGTGEEKPVEVNKIDKELVITSLVLIAGVSLVTAVLAIDKINKFYKASGTIDLKRLAKGEPECFAVDNLLDYFELGASMFGLVTWSVSTMAFAGVTITMDALYEIALANITSGIKDSVEQAFWDEVVSIILSGVDISRDTKMCWQLVNPISRWGKILEMRPDQLCTTSADCASLAYGTQVLNNIDKDQDGYTPAQSDCDDQNPRINPGAPEVCDSGVDYNCDDTTPTCNITTNAYMDGWPTGGSLSDNGSGEISLILFQGSFIGTGSDNISEARIIVNDDTEQRIGTTNNGGGQFGWLTYVGLKQGLNLIQVTGQGGTHYGSKTYHFTNTKTTDVFNVMLTWDACPGLRLYITEPDSAAVNYTHKTGIYGSMTFAPDTTTGWGPEIYEAANPAASQTYSFYAKYQDNGSCGASGTSTNYTIRVFTPYGDQVKTGTLSTLGQTGTVYDVSF